MRAIWYKLKIGFWGFCTLTKPKTGGCERAKTKYSQKTPSTAGAGKSSEIFLRRPIAVG
jgi:hypothetical protein